MSRIAGSGVKITKNFSCNEEKNKVIAFQSNSVYNCP